jgi:hypothetical protein
LRNEKISANLLSWVSLCGERDVREIMVKVNSGGGWSFDGMMLWLGMKQNGDAVEWWG